MQGFPEIMCPQTFFDTILLQKCVCFL